MSDIPTPGQRPTPQQGTGSEGAGRAEPAPALTWDLGWAATLAEILRDLQQEESRARRVRRWAP